MKFGVMIKAIATTAFIPNPGIIHLDKPVCQDCRHFQNSLFLDANFGKCARFGEKNIMTGNIHLEYAELCRKNEHKCGINATYFEKNSCVFPKLTRLCFRNANNCTDS
jgi:hypothetical protein